MKLISHRGNLNGPNPEQENQFVYLYNALISGFDVQIDVWLIDGMVWTGHDKPTYKFEWNQLYKLKVGAWIHCRNLEALKFFSSTYNAKQFYNWNFFWHQNDDFAITSNHLIWTYPGKELTSSSIVTLTNEYNVSYNEKDLDNCYGICSDNVIKLKGIYNAHSGI